MFVHVCVCPCARVCVCGKEGRRELFEAEMYKKYGGSSSGAATEEAQKLPKNC